VTLWRWRENNEGPRWCKINARVMYDASDVERFLEEKLRVSAPTSAAA
jgi:hypothetical protein